MEKERCPIMESDAQNWEAEFDPGLERGWESMAGRGWTI